MLSVYSSFGALPKLQRTKFILNLHYFLVRIILATFVLRGITVVENMIFEVLF